MEGPPFRTPYIRNGNENGKSLCGGLRYYHMVSIVTTHDYEVAKRIENGARL